MDTYRKYQEARDTAWRALLQLEEKTLPVDAEALARKSGAEVLPWPDPVQEERLFSLLERAGGGNCVSLRIRGRWHIFLRLDWLDGSRRRFSVAHELGHILLEHETRALMPGVHVFAGAENDGDLILDPQDLADYAADIFAIRLLSPACILHELHTDTAGGIAALCGLPPRAAALRAERMELLNQRNAFYKNPLERQVRDAFLPFLRARQGMEAPQAAAVAPRSPLSLVLPPRESAEQKEKPSPRRWLPWLAAALGAALGAALYFLLR